MARLRARFPHIAELRHEPPRWPAPARSSATARCARPVRRWSWPPPSSPTSRASRPANRRPNCCGRPWRRRNGEGSGEAPPADDRGLRALRRSGGGRLRRAGRRGAVPDPRHHRRRQDLPARCPLLRPVRRGVGRPQRQGAALRPRRPRRRAPGEPGVLLWHRPLSGGAHPCPHRPQGPRPGHHREAAPGGPVPPGCRGAGAGRGGEDHRGDPGSGGPGGAQRRPVPPGDPAAPGTLRRGAARQSRGARNPAQDPVRHRDLRAGRLVARRPGPHGAEPGAGPGPGAGGAAAPGGRRLGPPGSRVAGGDRTARAARRPGRPRGAGGGDRCGGAGHRSRPGGGLRQPDGGPGGPGGSHGAGGALGPARRRRRPAG